MNDLQLIQKSRKIGISCKNSIYNIFTFFLVAFFYCYRFVIFCYNSVIFPICKKSDFYPLCYITKILQLYIQLKFVCTFDRLTIILPFFSCTYKCKKQTSCIIHIVQNFPHGKITKNFPQLLKIFIYFFSTFNIAK